MKQYIYIAIVLVLVINIHTAQAQQKRFYIEPYARPFLYPLMNPTKSVGENYYNTKYIKQVTPEFGINAGVRVWKNLSIGVGYNRMQTKHFLTWQNYDISEPKVLKNAGRYVTINQSYYGLKLSLKYSLPKWYFEVNVSSNEPKYFQETIIQNIYASFAFPDTANSYAIVEDIRISGTHYVPTIPEIIVGYSPLKNIYIYAGLKTKWYGKETLSHVRYTLQQGGDSRTLTDVTIMNKYVMLSCGLSYQFWWKFKK